MMEKIVPVQQIVYGIASAENASIFITVEVKSPTASTLPVNLAIHPSNRREQFPAVKK